MFARLLNANLSARVISYGLTAVLIGFAACIASLSLLFV